MRCERCHGDGSIWSGPFNDGRGLRAGKMFPCPDCNGFGITHCCEGERPDCPPTNPTEEEEKQ